MSTVARGVIVVRLVGIKVGKRRDRIRVIVGIQICHGGFTSGCRRCIITHMPASISNAGGVVTIIVHTCSSSLASWESMRLMTEFGPLDFFAVGIKFGEPFTRKLPNNESDGTEDCDTTGD